MVAEKSHSHHHLHHHTKKKSSNIRDHLANTDLFNLYSMLNSIKVDLLWGRNGQEGEEMVEIKLREQNYDTITTVETIVTDTTALNMNNYSKSDLQISQSPNTESTNTDQKGHARRPSTVSVSSSNSSTSTISDSESEVSSNENDSGIESENQQEKDRTAEVAKQFRAHLFGLYQSLEQMTEAAGYLTARYQSDMGGGC